MDRRAFLRAGAGAASAAALAGCTGLFETRSVTTRNPPIAENRPNAVYFPSHIEGMQMYGTSGMGSMSGMQGMNGSGGMNGTNSSGAASESGEYVFGLMYSYAHRFWNVNGAETSKTAIEDGDTMHLMASVWDAKTKTVLPETGLSVEVTREGDLVSEEVIYPMLSQPMGFHYGGNFGLSGDGSYTAKLSVGGTSTRRTGALEGRLGEPASAEIDFEYSESAKEEIMFNILDNSGEKGAVEPMEMEMIPDSVAPAKSDLPGEVVGETTSGDATLVATVLDEPPSGVDGAGRYLAVSARSPYNRYILPAMGVSGCLNREGETVSEGALERTLDPDLGYHYGAAVEGVKPGDELALSVGTPPQVARHEGYETAFLDMADASLTVA